MVWHLLQAAMQCPLTFLFSVLVVLLVLLVLVLVLVLVLLFRFIRQPLIALITRLKAVSKNMFFIFTVLSS